MKILMALLIVVFLTSSAYCDDYIDMTCRKDLTAEQIETVKRSKELIRGIDDKTLQETIESLQHTACPSIQVIMMQAMTVTYRELIVEYDLNDLDARKRLYNKIQMNMAYLQFTAGETKGDNSSLNRLIRMKLKEYLPNELLSNPVFYSSLE